MNGLDVLTPVLAIALCAILVMLIRSITKMYERIMDGSGKGASDPQELYGVLENAINEAVKKSEDRTRKRVKRLEVNEMTDEEVEEILEGRKKEEYGV